MTEQGYPPRQSSHSGHFGSGGHSGHTGNPGRPSRPRAAQESRNDGWQVLGAFEPGSDEDSDLPPWAIPGGIEPMRPARRATRTAEAEPAAPEIAAEEPRTVRSARSGGSGRRPGRSRAAATRRRRSRRRLTTWGSVAVVAAVIAVAVYYLTEPSTPTHPYVTTLQKGEFRTVPNACRLIAPSALSQYLNGRPSKSVQTFAAAAKSECTFQVDAKTFRELDITMQAYTPSLIAPGNGSATSYARYTFAQTRQVLATPPKGAAQPPASIKPLSGPGSQAFAAVQLYRQRSKTDLVIVLVQLHNVLITVKLWASVGGSFGSVSIPQLQGYAEAAARTTATAVSSQPPVT